MSEQRTATTWARAWNSCLNVHFQRRIGVESEDRESLREEFRQHWHVEAPLEMRQILEEVLDAEVGRLCQKRPRCNEGIRVPQFYSRPRDQKKVSSAACSSGALSKTALFCKGDRACVPPRRGGCLRPTWSQVIWSLITILSRGGDVVRHAHPRDVRKDTESLL